MPAAAHWRHSPQSKRVTVLHHPRLQCRILVRTTEKRPSLRATRVLPVVNDTLHLVERTPQVPADDGYPDIRQVVANCFCLPQQKQSVLRGEGHALNVTNCHFIKQCVNYLGHFIHPNKLKVAANNTAAVAECRNTKTQT